MKVLTYYTKAPNYRWNTCLPQSWSDMSKFENPFYPAIVKGRAPTRYHIELYYHEGCHYDRISHQILGKSSVCLPNPLMPDHVGLLSNSKEKKLCICVSVEKLLSLVAIVSFSVFKNYTFPFILFFFVDCNLIFLPSSYQSMLARVD